MERPILYDNSYCDSPVRPETFDSYSNRNPDRGLIIVKNKSLSYVGIHRFVWSELSPFVILRLLRMGEYLNFWAADNNNSFYNIVDGYAALHAIRHIWFVVENRYLGKFVRRTMEQEQDSGSVMYDEPKSDESKCGCSEKDIDKRLKTMADDLEKKLEGESAPTRKSKEPMKKIIVLQID